MRIGVIIFVVSLACLPGCTAARLRQRTISQGSTLSELQYQQVLGNLASFAKNPSALPWHVNLREGTTQVTDSATAGALIDLGPPAVTQPQAFGSRTSVSQWGMSPVIDTIELRLMRVAYRRASGVPEMPSSDLLDELAHELKDQIASNADLRNESELFYEAESHENWESGDHKGKVITTNDTEFWAGDESSRREVSPLARNVRRKIAMLENELARIEPGWHHVGCKRDVPKTACYVGKCGTCYAWVDEDGLEALTEFTLTVLKLSTLIKETQTLIQPGSVKFSPGDRGG